MFNRLFQIFRAENSNSQFVILAIIAFVINILFVTFGNAVMHTLMQLGGSWLIALILAKSGSFDQSNTRKGLLVLFIIISLFYYIF